MTSFVVSCSAPPKKQKIGSYDRITWEKYRFKWKPPLNEYQYSMYYPLHWPRLDWMVWFIPLRMHRGSFGGIQNVRIGIDSFFPLWYSNLMKRLCEGEETVTNLLGYDPFKGRDPPLYVRTVVYEYDIPNWKNVEDGKRWWIIRGPMREFSSVRSHRREERRVSWWEHINIINARLKGLPLRNVLFFRENKWTRKCVVFY